MNTANIQTRKSGGWQPGNDAGGHQLQKTIGSIKQRNQLQPGAFLPDEMLQIRAAIHKKYAAVAKSASGYFKYMVGKEGALQLGYSKELLDALPDALLNSFCGVGNPLNIAPIKKGSYILDIGCGAGFDLFAASRLTGVTGRVCGVDLTREMVARARANLSALPANNCEVLEVTSESLPFSNHTFDVVLSNGVINLSPDKPALFSEIHRVLKPGGQLQFADIILEKELPQHLAAGLESWSQWIGGAISGGDQLLLMENAGFTEVVELGKTPAKTSEYTVGALFLGKKPSWSKEQSMNTLKINGMSCQHCVGAVKKALEKIPGLSQIAVHLEAGEVTFASNGVDRQEIRAAISKIGFEPGE